MPSECCKMKGFLTFLILWIVSRQPGNGQDIAREIAKRKGDKPSPGTIYPVLKELSQKGAIEQRDGIYTITKKGSEEIRIACAQFKDIFYDMEDMRKCCRK